MDIGGWIRIRLRRRLSAGGGAEGLEDGYRRIEEQKA